MFVPTSVLLRWDISVALLTVLDGATVSDMEGMSTVLDGATVSDTEGTAGLNAGCDGEGLVVSCGWPCLYHVVDFVAWVSHVAGRWY